MSLLVGVLLRISICHKQHVTPFLFEMKWQLCLYRAADVEDYTHTFVYEQLQSLFIVYLCKY